MQAHLVEDLAHADSLRVRGDEECCDAGRPLIGSGSREHDIEARVTDVGDEHLGAVELVVTAIAPRSRLERGCVGPRRRLRQGKSAQQLARRQRRQPPSLLRLVAEEEDRLGAHAGVDVHDDRGRGAGLGQLFDADRKRQGVEAGATKLGRNKDSKQPGFLCRLHGFNRETVLAVDLACVRQDDALRELTDCGAKLGVLGRKFEVQLRRYLE